MWRRIFFLHNGIWVWIWVNKAGSPSRRWQCAPGAAQVASTTTSPQGTRQVPRVQDNAGWQVGLSALERLTRMADSTWLQQQNGTTGWTDPPSPSGPPWGIHMHLLARRRSAFNSNSSRQQPIPRYFFFFFAVFRSLQTSKNFTRFSVTSNL
jgi:hypothetical protein